MDISISLATLPAPALLPSIAASAHDSPLSLRCTVHLMAGRFRIASTAAAATTLHFSTEYTVAAGHSSHSDALSADLTAALTQPWSLTDRVLPRPATLTQHVASAVIGDVAAPAGGIDGYRLHPGVLDGCLQLGAAGALNVSVELVSTIRARSAFGCANSVILLIVRNQKYCTAAYCFARLRVCVQLHRATTYTSQRPWKPAAAPRPLSAK